MNRNPIRNKTIARVTNPRERHTSPSDRKRGVTSTRALNGSALFGSFLEKGEFGLDMDSHPSWSGVRSVLARASWL